MNIKVHEQDGHGGFLTTEHPTSSYGMPVFVPNKFTAGVWKSAGFHKEGSAYGPADLSNPLVLEEPVTTAQRERILAAGFRLAN